MEDFRRAGKTVFLVSHALAAVRENCRRAVWIHEGRLVRDGDSASVTELYHGWSAGEAVALPQAL
jgi:teichoic acid transport system ATP-binding protein